MAATIVLYVHWNNDNACDERHLNVNTLYGNGFNISLLIVFVCRDGNCGPLYLPCACHSTVELYFFITCLRDGWKNGQRNM